MLLFQRLLDNPAREDSVTTGGKPIYLAVSTDLRGPRPEPKDPSGRGDSGSRPATLSNGKGFAIPEHVQRPRHRARIR